MLRLEFFASLAFAVLVTAVVLASLTEARKGKLFPPLHHMESTR